MTTKQLFHRQIISRFFFRLGVIFLLGPVLLYLLIILPGNFIIRGPFPFSHLGGATYQLAADIILVFIGLIFLGISKLVKPK